MQYIDSLKLLSLVRDNPENLLISLPSIDFYKCDLRLDALEAGISGRNPVNVYDISSYADRTSVIDVHNRKYIGSKWNLMGFLEEAILGAAGKKIDSFFDCFSGTGSVASMFRRYAKKVIANDILYSNHLIQKAFLASSRDSISIERLTRLISHLNSVFPKKSYAYNTFGGTYFTEDNACRIDGIRDEIETLSNEKECTPQEKACLVTSLLYACDKAANTVGQYDAFLKHIGSPCRNSGRHVIDSNVYNPIRLKRPFIFFDLVNEIYREDAVMLASRVEAEVAYLDPPYNSRQYVDCYHVLENIARWEKPPTFGKTKKYRRESEKSMFSKKRNAHAALSALVEKLRCPHIFLSYNSEGIIAKEQIISILKKKGSVRILEKEYPVFGQGAGVSVKRKVIERLYYCRA